MGACGHVYSDGSHCELTKQEHDWVPMEANDTHAFVEPAAPPPTGDAVEATTAMEVVCEWAREFGDRRPSIAEKLLASRAFVAGARAQRERDERIVRDQVVEYASAGIGKIAALLHRIADAIAKEG